MTYAPIGLLILSLLFIVMAAHISASHEYNNEESFVTIIGSFAFIGLGALCIITSLVMQSDEERITKEQKRIALETENARALCMQFSEFKRLGLTIETDFFGGRINCISFRE